MAPITRQWLRNASVHDVIPGARFRAAAISHDTIRHLVAREILFRVYRDVYATRPDLTDRGRWLAATLAVRGVLSHLCAAALWALIAPPPFTEVTVPRSGGRKDPEGLRVHRSLLLNANSVTRRDRIEVTTLARTLDDIAPRLTDHALHQAVRQAERLHFIDIHRTHAETTSPKLRRLLDGYVAGEAVAANELEASFFALCAQAGLPRPTKQPWIGETRRVDFLFSEFGLIVETDGRSAHDRSLAFQDDRARDRQLKIAGFEVLHFTWAEVVHDPQLVIADLTAWLQANAGRRTSRSIVPQAR